MIHPLIKLIASRPELLVHHAAGYGQLFAVQAEEAALQLRLRAVLAAVAVVCAGAGIGLGGVALLLLAAVSLAEMPHPWLLLLVPLAPLAVAAGCGAVLFKKPPAWSLDKLREQMAADVAMLHEVSSS